MQIYTDENKLNIEMQWQGFWLIKKWKKSSNLFVVR